MLGSDILEPAPDPPVLAPQQTMVELPATKPRRQYRRRRLKTEEQRMHPKRPRTAFMLFSNFHRPQLMQQFMRTLGLPGISKKLGQLWRNVDPEEKKQWDEKALEDRRRYEDEMAKFPQRPKKPPKSAYIIFVREQYALSKLEGRDMKFGDFSKFISGKWKALDQEARQPFYEKLEHMKLQYEQDMETFRTAWESFRRQGDEKEADEAEAAAPAELHPHSHVPTPDMDPAPYQPAQ